MRRVTLKKLFVIAAVVSPFAYAAPTEQDVDNYRARCALYSYLGYTPEQTLRALKNWFGKEFETREDLSRNVIDVQIVERVDRYSGPITYLRNVCAMRRQG